MPTAKLILEHSAAELPRQPNRLAGATVADHRDLGKKFSVADLGIPVGRAADSWDIAYEAVRETPGRFIEPDFPSGFHVDTPATQIGRAAADLPHPRSQFFGDL